MCSDIGDRAPLLNVEMWLVGAQPWRTTATCSKTSAWVELTTVDMLTFLRGLPSLRWQFYLFFFSLFISDFYEGAGCHRQIERVGRI